MRDNTKRRNSRNQTETLLLLLAMEEKGIRKPTPFCGLLEMLNTQRLNPVARQNYYAGLKNTRDKGLILIFRDRTLKLHAALTDEGRELAKALAEEAE